MLAISLRSRFACALAIRYPAIKQRPGRRMRMMDWDDPGERAALRRQVGVKKFNRMFNKFYQGNIAVTVHGHNIRPTKSGFVVMGREFKSLEAAIKFAASHAKGKCKDDTWSI
jgi:hypothetical protein